MCVAVIGSINIDLVYENDRPPKQGETVEGNTYTVEHGGKGANQALLLRSLTDNVHFLGAVGNDVFSDLSINNLKDKHLKTDNIIQKPAPSGLALVALFNQDNAITVFGGANALLSQDDVTTFFDQHPDLTWVVTQLEIPLKTVTHLINEASRRNIKVILNPAPAKKLSMELLKKCTYIIPNESEFSVLFPKSTFEEQLQAMNGKLLITLGAQGVKYYHDNQVHHSPAPKVNVIDTTGAGDSFIAGFTASIIKNTTIETAIKQGMALAEKTIQCRGAQCIL